MAGYRRFIAYVYEYNKGRKGCNCGFVKIEVRNEKCVIEVHLQCMGLAAGSNCGIYGLVRKDGLIDGILLGEEETTNGKLECFLETDAESMGGSGVSLEKLGGMILKTDMGAFFGTEWDDQPISPVKFRVRELEKVQDFPEKSSEILKEEDVSVKEKIKEEVRKTKNKEEEREREKQQEEKQKEKQQEEGQKKQHREEKYQEEEQKEQFPENLQAEDMTETGQNETESQTVISSEKTVSDCEVEITEIREKEKDQYSGMVQENEAESQPRMMQENEKKQNAVTMGEDFCPFGDGDFIWCKRIRLQDLACLGRKSCALRNNRFLQHGYYHFGHLLLAQKENGQYLLGVPGGYNQQEAFMAGMFGFPEFRESSQIELAQGRGGYWYRLIDTPDFNERNRG